MRKGPEAGGSGGRPNNTSVINYSLPEQQARTPVNEGLAKLNNNSMKKLEAVVAEATSSAEGQNRVFWELPKTALPAQAHKLSGEKRAVLIDAALVSPVDRAENRDFDESVRQAGNKLAEAREKTAGSLHYEDPEAFKVANVIVTENSASTPVVTLQEALKNSDTYTPNPDNTAQMAAETARNSRLIVDSLYGKDAQGRTASEKIRTMLIQQLAQEAQIDAADLPQDFKSDVNPVDAGKEYDKLDEAATQTKIQRAGGPTSQMIRAIRTMVQQRALLEQPPTPGASDKPLSIADALEVLETSILSTMIQDAKYGKKVLNATKVGGDILSDKFRTTLNKAIDVAAIDQTVRNSDPADNFQNRRQDIRKAMKDGIRNTIGARLELPITGGGTKTWTAEQHSKHGEVELYKTVVPNKIAFTLKGDTTNNFDEWTESGKPYLRGLKVKEDAATGQGVEANRMLDKIARAAEASNAASAGILGEGARLVAELSKSNGAENQSVINARATLENRLNAGKNGADARTFDRVFEAINRRDTAESGVRRMMGYLYEDAIQQIEAKKQANPDKYKAFDAAIYRNLAERTARGEVSDNALQEALLVVASADPELLKAVSNNILADGMLTAMFEQSINSRGQLDQKRLAEVMNAFMTPDASTGERFSAPKFIEFFLGDSSKYDGIRGRFTEFRDKFITNRAIGEAPRGNPQSRAAQELWRAARIRAMSLAYGDRSQDASLRINRPANGNGTNPAAAGEVGLKLAQNERLGFIPEGKTAEDLKNERIAVSARTLMESVQRAKFENNDQGNTSTEVGQVVINGEALSMEETAAIIDSFGTGKQTQKSFWENLSKGIGGKTWGQIGKQAAITIATSVVAAAAVAAGAAPIVVAVAGLAAGFGAVAGTAKAISNVRNGASKREALAGLALGMLTGAGSTAIAPFIPGGIAVSFLVRLSINAAAVSFLDRDRVDNTALETRLREKVKGYEDKVLAILDSENIDKKLLLDIGESLGLKVANPDAELTAAARSAMVEKIKEQRTALRANRDDAKAKASLKKFGELMNLQPDVVAEVKAMGEQLLTEKVAIEKADLNAQTAMIAFGVGTIAGSMGWKAVAQSGVLNGTFESAGNSIDRMMHGAEYEKIEHVLNGENNPAPDMHVVGIQHHGAQDSILVDANNDGKADLSITVDHAKYEQITNTVETPDVNAPEPADAPIENNNPGSGIDAADEPELRPIAGQAMATNFEGMSNEEIHRFTEKLGGGGGGGVEPVNPQPVNPELPGGHDEPRLDGSGAPIGPMPPVENHTVDLGGNGDAPLLTRPPVGDVISHPGQPLDLGGNGDVPLQTNETYTPPIEAGTPGANVEIPTASAETISTTEFLSEAKIELLPGASLSVEVVETHFQLTHPELTEAQLANYEVQTLEGASIVGSPEGASIPFAVTHVENSVTHVDSLYAQTASGVTTIEGGQIESLFDTDFRFESQAVATGEFDLGQQHELRVIEVNGKPELGVVVTVQSGELSASGIQVESNGVALPVSGSAERTTIGWIGLNDGVEHFARLSAAAPDVTIPIPEGVDPAVAEKLNDVQFSITENWTRSNGAVSTFGGALATQLNQQLGIPMDQAYTLAYRTAAESNWFEETYGRSENLVYKGETFDLGDILGSAPNAARDIGLAAQVVDTTPAAVPTIVNPGGLLIIESGHAQALEGLLAPTSTTPPVLPAFGGAWDAVLQVTSDPAVMVGIVIGASTVLSGFLRGAQAPGAATNNSLGSAKLAAEDHARRAAANTAGAGNPPATPSTPTAPTPPGSPTAPTPPETTAPTAPSGPTAPTPPGAPTPSPVTPPTPSAPRTPGRPGIEALNLNEVVNEAPVNLDEIRSDTDLTPEQLVKLTPDEIITLVEDGRLTREQLQALRREYDSVGTFENANLSDFIDAEFDGLSNDFAAAFPADRLNEIQDPVRAAEALNMIDGRFKAVTKALVEGIITRNISLAIGKLNGAPEASLQTFKEMIESDQEGIKGIQQRNEQIKEAIDSLNNATPLFKERVGVPLAASVVRQLAKGSLYNKRAAAEQDMAVNKIDEIMKEYVKAPIEIELTDGAARRKFEQHEIAELVRSSGNDLNAALEARGATADDIKRIRFEALKKADAFALIDDALSGQLQGSLRTLVAPGNDYKDRTAQAGSLQRTKDLIKARKDNLNVMIIAAGLEMRDSTEKPELTRELNSRYDHAAEVAQIEAKLTPALETNLTSTDNTVFDAATKELLEAYLLMTDLGIDASNKQLTFPRDEARLQAHATEWTTLGGNIETILTAIRGGGTPPAPRPTGGRRFTFDRSMITGPLMRRVAAFNRLMMPGAVIPRVARPPERLVTERMAEANVEAKALYGEALGKARYTAREARAMNDRFERSRRSRYALIEELMHAATTTPAEKVTLNQVLLQLDQEKDQFRGEFSTDETKFKARAALVLGREMMLKDAATSKPILNSILAGFDSSDPATQALATTFIGGERADGNINKTVALRLQGDKTKTAAVYFNRFVTRFSERGRDIYRGAALERFSQFVTNRAGHTNFLENDSQKSEFFSNRHNLGYHGLKASLPNFKFENLEAGDGQFAATLKPQTEQVNRQIVANGNYNLLAIRPNDTSTPEIQAMSEKPGKELASVLRMLKPDLVAGAVGVPAIPDTEVDAAIDFYEKLKPDAAAKIDTLKTARESFYSGIEAELASNPQAALAKAIAYRQEHAKIIQLRIEDLEEAAATAGTTAEVRGLKVLKAALENNPAAGVVLPPNAITQFIVDDLALSRHITSLETSAAAAATGSQFSEKTAIPFAINAVVLRNLAATAAVRDSITHIAADNNEANLITFARNNLILEARLSTAEANGGTPPQRAAKLNEIKEFIATHKLTVADATSPTIIEAIRYAAPHLILGNLSQQSRGLIDMIPQADGTLVLSDAEVAGIRLDIKDQTDAVNKIVDSTTQPQYRQLAGLIGALKNSQFQTEAVKAAPDGLGLSATEIADAITHYETLLATLTPEKRLEQTLARRKTNTEAILAEVRGGAANISPALRAELNSLRKTQAADLIDYAAEVEGRGGPANIEKANLLRIFAEDLNADYGKTGAASVAAFLIGEAWAGSSHSDADIAKGIKFEFDNTLIDPVTPQGKIVLDAVRALRLADTHAPGGANPVRVQLRSILENAGVYIANAINFSAESAKAPGSRSEPFNAVENFVNSLPNPIPAGFDISEANSKAFFKLAAVTAMLDLDDEADIVLNSLRPDVADPTKLVIDQATFGASGWESGVQRVKEMQAFGTLLPANRADLMGRLELITRENQTKLQAKLGIPQAKILEVISFFVPGP